MPVKGLKSPFTGTNRVRANIAMIFPNRFFYGWLMMNGLVLDFFKYLHVILALKH